ncbi:MULTISPECIES: dithiol-disulfide isomerase [Bacillus]|uniref:dithiol-disulfide isomerase n=1 Tax=Bacillus TaxID=1386 RepID=UPI0009B46AA2|nr:MULTISPECIES: dithiol-disulfide isomerase [Bacillus cereus group]OTY50770.1 dithiol-disulfide isomerase [Bacillus thuringiensis serovar graciosensis]
MMRVATVTKSIKKAIIRKFPLCLSVCLLYEIKDEKERNVRKMFGYFRNLIDMDVNVC